MIGTTIDQYRIVARIGGGGMGEVYRAIDLELQRDVAIKCVRPELSDLEEVTKRFRNEARTLAKLSHPNIATVYRFFTDNERLFLVMEYIQGTPFGGKLQGGALPWQEAVSMVRDALHGLGYAHEHGIVHRDIKPGNLMVDQRGAVKVLDFGIAHLVGGTRLTRAGSVVGTPAYMAPEQILGKAVDPRTDLYSLGIVLYELLSGQLPYQGDSEFELMRSHLERMPPPLRDLTSSKIPVALQNTVETALGKEKEDRFQSAAEFDEALGEALDDKVSVRVSKTTVLPQQDQSTPQQPMSELIRPVATEIRNRMRPSQIGAGAAIAVVVLAGFFLLRPGEGEGPAVAGNVVTPPAGQPQLFGQQGLMQSPLQAGGQGAPGAVATLPDGTVLQAGGGPAPLGVQPMVNGDMSGAGGMLPPAGGGGAGSMPVQSGDGGMAMPASGLVGSASAPPVQTASPPTMAVVPSRQDPPRSPAPVQRPVEVRPATPAAGGLSIAPVKVSVHERQGTGRWSRDAGYNGAFTLRFPPGRGQGLPVEEVVVVRQQGQVIKRIPVTTETRVPGQFKAKNRVPGLKELPVGLYDLELQFVAEGRTIGSYKWRLEVVN